MSDKLSDKQILKLAEKHHALHPGIDEWWEFRDREDLLAFAHELLAASHAPAIPAEPVPPFGWVQPYGGNYFTRSEVAAKRIGGLMPVYASPPASIAPAISESEDARKTCMCSGLGPCERRTDGSCRVSAPANLASAISRHVVIDWAVERWTLEVSGRPLGNIQRRSLDDAWRQFIRYLGADDVSLLGPRHDDLIAAHSLSIPMPDSEGGEA
ncbi:hypothetical protein [Burkholderia glumae]|uniref:hypothetical protein n=1 Tax=Burkholderia glumae TaxID=337 RepID=UPI0020369AE1|nr:hypothetical protein [Burkholderia glumae]MCM2547614.1 hypothetical protein [Burkholderia glumae]